jgi:hypothetical protein
MKRRVYLGIALLSLVFGALPVLAAPADPGADAWAAIFAPASAPDPGAPSQPQDAAKRPRITPKADCLAHCWDGSTVSCSGSTCSAADSACPGTRGSCTADGVTTYCPVCQTTTCTVTATCLPSGSVTCSSSNNDCFKVNKCYVECDGVLHWCPSHGVCPF